MWPGWPVRFPHCVLREWIRPKLDEYCDDCKQRFERNVFRVLDCKVRSCKQLNRDAPAFVEFLVERLERLP